MSTFFSPIHPILDCQSEHTMFKCFILVLLCSASHGEDTQVQGKVKGDSTVGGFHFLEIHASTAELGIKILLFLLLCTLIVYGYLKYKAKMLKRKRALQPIIRDLAASYRVDPESLNAMLPYVMAQHQHTLPRPGTSRNEPVRSQEDEEEIITGRLTGRCSRT